MQGVFPLPAEGSSCYGTAQITTHRSLPSNSGARGIPADPNQECEDSLWFPPNQRIGHISAPVLPLLTALAQHQVLIPRGSDLNFTMITIFKAKWQLLKRIRDGLQSLQGIGGRDAPPCWSQAVRNAPSRNLNALSETGKSRGYGAFSLPHAKGNPFSKDLGIRRAFFGHREVTSGFDPPKKDTNIN